MIRKLLAAVFTCALLAGPALAADKEKLVIAMPNRGIAITPLYLAISGGYFDKLGLDVQMLYLDGGTKAIAALLGGEAQIYMAPILDVFAAQAGGAGMVECGVINNHINSNVVVSKQWAKDHNVTETSSYEDKLKALKGARIAVTSLGSSTAGIVRYLAGAAGLNPDRDMQIVSVGSNVVSMLAAMENKYVDIFVLSSPAPELAKKQFEAVNLFNFGRGDVKSLDVLAWNGVIAYDKWLKEHPETITKYLLGLQQAMNDLQDSSRTEEAKKLVVKSGFVTGLDNDILDASWTNLRLLVPAKIEITKTMVENTIKFWNVYAPEKIDLSAADKYFTNEYAAKAIEMSQKGK